MFLGKATLLLASLFAYQETKRNLECHVQEGVKQHWGRLLVDGLIGLLVKPQWPR